MNIRTIGAVAACSLYLLCVATAWAAPAVQLSNASGYRATHVEVPVSFVTDVPVTEIQFDVKYDPAAHVSAAGVSRGGVLRATGHTVSSSEVAAGTRRVVVTAPIPGTAINSGVISNLSFLLRGDPAPGAPIAVTRWRGIKMEFSSRYRLPKVDRKCAAGVVSGESGKDAFGNTSSATMPATAPTWITGI